jgi:hypothetical protein
MRESWRNSRENAQESGLSQPISFEVLHNDQSYPCHYLWNAHLFLDHHLRIQFCELLLTNGLRMSTFYVTLCGQTKYVLRLKTCSASTRVTFGHQIVLTLLTNVGIKSSLTSEFELEPSRKLLLGFSVTGKADCSATSCFSGNCSVGAV